MDGNQVVKKSTNAAFKTRQTGIFNKQAATNDQHLG